MVEEVRISFCLFCSMITKYEKETRTYVIMWSMAFLVYPERNAEQKCNGPHLF